MMLFDSGLLFLATLYTLLLVLVRIVYSCSFWSCERHPMVLLLFSFLLYCMLPFTGE